MAETWRNWAGNQRARPRRILVPRSAEEVARAVVAAAGDGLRVRVAGSGHSFTGAAVTDGVLLRSEGLSRVRSLDAARGLVTVEAGCRLDTLNAYLAGHGLALANLGDITAQTAAGAIQTATHGTGRTVGGLASQVHALELVLADGSAAVCSAEREPDLFHAARVGLGALGVVTAVTFRVVPAFLLRAVERAMPLDEVLDRLDELHGGNDHFEFFWFPHTGAALTKRNNRVEGPAAPLRPLRAWFDDEFLGNSVYDLMNRLGRRVPAATPLLNRCAAGALGARDYTDASARVFTTPRRFRFVEMEYAIPRAQAAGALRAVRALVERGPYRTTMPLEVRFTPADDAWLATSHGRDTAYVAAHVYRGAPYRGYFGALEEVFTGLGGRPHWGKLHTLDAGRLRTVYPRFDDFVGLRDRLDPGRRFGNAYLERVLGS